MPEEESAETPAENNDEGSSPDSEPMVGEIINKAKDLGVRSKGRALKKIKFEDLQKIAKKVQQAQVGKVRQKMAGVEEDLSASQSALAGL